MCSYRVLCGLFNLLALCLSKALFWQVPVEFLGRPLLTELGFMPHGEHTAFTETV